MLQDVQSYARDVAVGREQNVCLCMGTRVCVYLRVCGCGVKYL